MKKLLIILLISFAHSLFGQSISIFDIDTTNFPTMKAKFWAFDKDGNQVRPSVSELTISENGINRKITNVSCPIPPPIKRVSVAMSIDVSGSMSQSDFGEIPVELGKLTATTLCNEIAMPPSEFALQTCDDKAFIIQDFTNNRNKILNSIPPIKAFGGNNFVEHLLNKITGLLNIAKTGKYKRVAVLYTDAWWYTLEPKELKSCLDTCKKYNIEFYTIIYSRKEAEPNGIKASLKEICDKTGGIMYDDIISTEAAKDIANKIQKIVQGAEPCDITWESGINCFSDNIKVELTWLNIKGTSNYIIPKKSIASLKVSPSFFSFGKISIPVIKDTIITLTALNSDFIINNIKLNYGSSIFSIININFPILISKNTSKNITLRCTPLDSSNNYSSFEIETDMCSAYFSANVSYPNKKIKTKTLKLTKPNGGETFIAGSDTNITWEGISPNDTCTLDLSIDSGKTWENITSSASNLKYYWNPIPKKTSETCLIKIKQNGIRNINKDNVITLSGYRNGNFVTSVAISQDGTIIVTGNNDHTAKIRDVNTGVEILTLSGHTNGVSSVAISQDGSKIVTGSHDGTAKIWDANTGVEIRTLAGHTYMIRSVAISQDGTKIVTGSWDNTAKIWDANTGKEIQTLSGHIREVNSVAISQDGSKIVTGSGDLTTKIWDANTGKEIQTLSGHTSYVLNVAISQDGSKIVTGSGDSTAKIWDVNSGLLIRTLTGHTSYVSSVAISQDGSKIITGSWDNTAKIWDANTGILIKTLSGHTREIYSLAISQDGTKIVTGSHDGTAKIWDISDLILIQEDQSDEVFSIVEPLPSSQDIDMKQCLVGRTKDSLISRFVMNKINYPFRVDSIYFTGVDASAFSQVSGFPKFIVDSNSSKTVELRFQPKRIGFHKAKVNIITQTDTLVQDIIGEGVQPSIEIVNNWIDFGYVDINTIKDTLRAVTIKNTSSSDIDITNTYHLGPNDKDFTTLAGGGAFKLKAGETAKLDLRFAPQSMGRTSGRLMFEFNGAGSPAMVQLFGEGIGGEAILKIDSFATKTGTLIDIPINLTLDSKVLKSGTKAFNFEIAYNKTLLFPLETYNTKEKNGYSLIRFDNMPITTDPLQVIKTLKFQTALGNAVETPLEIRTLEPIGNTEDIDVTMIDGKLTLTDVCYDGGVRLLNGTTQTNLFSIFPNPANDNIEIEYSNADNGLAEFKLINVMGEVVNSIILEKTQNGKTKMNLKNLPSGQYFGVFNTESINQNMIISVIR